MRRHPPKVVRLTRADRRELQRVLDNGRTEQRTARRSQVLLRMSKPKTIVADLAQRVGIEQLACCDLAGLGLNLTHWSTRALAQIADARGIRPKIAHSTVALIL